MPTTEKMTRWKDLEFDVPTAPGTPSDDGYPIRLEIEQVWADTTRCFFMSGPGGFVTTNLNRLNSPRCADLDDGHFYTDERETGIGPLMMRSLAYQMAAEGAEVLGNETADPRMMWAAAQAFTVDHMIIREANCDTPLPLSDQQLVGSIAREAARHRERERLGTAREFDFTFWEATVDLTPATLEHITQAPLSSTLYSEVASPYPSDVHFPEGWDGGYPTVPRPIPSGCAIAE